MTIANEALAVPLGDPAGIGPEIVARAWEGRKAGSLPPFFAIGGRRALEAVWGGPVRVVDEPGEAGAIFDEALPLLDLGGAEPVEPGRPSMEGAYLALRALEIGVGLARSGAAAGVVTGPVSKAALYAVGFVHPGQTEFIAEACGVAAANAAMMLAGPSLRAVPATVHLPLAQVPGALTTELLLAKARVVLRGLARDFGVPAPRLAVAGLNPHAGEDGALGTEERDVIRPAIDVLRAEGHDVVGPLSADTMFHERARARYDAALCMYHDQALIPLKALHFDEGVNVTLGLPIVRTAPDHGTAFALAGKGEASPGAVIAAIRTAGECAAHRYAAAAAA